MSKRKPISDRLKWQSLLYWHSVECLECGELITPRDDIEWDHRHALVHGGAHVWSNIAPLHAACHTQKTIRDVKANAKVKRIIKKRNGEARPKRKIPPKRDHKWGNRKMSSHVNGWGRRAG